MKIRELVPSDFPKVDALMNELHSLHARKRPDVYVPAEQIYSESAFLSMLSAENSFAIGAETEGELIGICFFEIRKTSSKEKKGVAENTVGFISDIVVAEKFRRKGAAKELFDAAEKTAKENGASRLDLMVWNFNRDAVEFYKAMGMEVQRYVFEKFI